MSKYGSCDFSDLIKLQHNLEKIINEKDRIIKACAKEIAARLLAKVVKRTPTGDYSSTIEVTAKKDSKYHKKGDVYTKKVKNKSGKVGGTLKRGWTSDTEEEAKKGKGKPSAEDIKNRINVLNVAKVGDVFEIEISNPVEYASYVEQGHRIVKRKTKETIGWVEGKFMLRISAEEIQNTTPKILENKITKMLGDVFK